MVFSIAGVAQRAIALLLLPVFLAHLAPADYGRLAIAWSVAGVLAAIVSMGFETAVFRGYFTLGDDWLERDRYVVSNALFVLVVSLAGAASLSGFLAMLDRFVDFGIPVSYFALALFAAALYVSATAVPLAVLRAERRLKAFVSVNAAYVAVSVAAMIVLVVVRDGGGRGWLLATLLASVAALAISAATLWRLRARPAASCVAAALAVGLPLVPHTLSHWGLGLSDRIILGAFVPIADVGVYNVGYQLAAGLGLIFAAVNQSVMAEHGRVLRGDVALNVLARVVKPQLTFTLLAGAVAAIAAPVAVRTLLPSSYEEAATLIPWLILANVLYGLYMIPMNSIVLLGGNTRRIWRATAAAAVTSVALNLILVPVAGMAAAAATTVVTYGILLVIVVLLARRRNVPIVVGSLRRVGIALAVGVAVTALALLTAPREGLAGAGVAMLWAGIACAAILLALSIRPAGGRRPSESAGFHA